MLVVWDAGFCSEEESGVTNCVVNCNPGAADVYFNVQEIPTFAIGVLPSGFKTILHLEDAVGYGGVLWERSSKAVVSHLPQFMPANNTVTHPMHRSHCACLMWPSQSDDKIYLQIFACSTMCHLQPCDRWWNSIPLRSLFLVISVAPCLTLSSTEMQVKLSVQKLRGCKVPKKGTFREHIPEKSTTVRVRCGKKLTASRQRFGLQGRRSRSAKRNHFNWTKSEFFTSTFPPLRRWLVLVSAPCSEAAYPNAHCFIKQSKPENWLNHIDF